MMDLAMIVLTLALGALVAAMAAGCARLGGRP
jgi:hypothetical protein